MYLTLLLLCSFIFVLSLSVQNELFYFLYSDFFINKDIISIWADLFLASNDKLVFSVACGWWVAFGFLGICGVFM